MARLYKISNFFFFIYFQSGFRLFTNSLHEGFFGKKLMKRYDDGRYRLMKYINQIPFRIYRANNYSYHVDENDLIQCRLSLHQKKR